MVAIDSIQLRDNLFIRVDKYPHSGINPKTNRYEDMGILYLFTLFTKIDNPNSNLQVASCVLYDNALVTRFGVHCDHYGKGYGTILINYVKAFASTKGYTSLKMYITPLTKLMMFFEKRGFKLLENETINGKLLVRAEMPLESSQEPKEVMSYRNGHNHHLVDKINWIGNDPTRKPMLHSILKFLAIEYGDECRQDACINGEITDDVIEQYGYDILTNVCDDRDLKTIISYCRIDSLLPQDKERFSNVDEIINHFNKPFKK